VPSGGYVCLLLLPVAVLGTYRLATTEPIPYPTIDQETEPVPGVLIDPNVAPWWELTVVPGIGEVTAKKIVEYREARRRKRDPASGTHAGRIDVFQRTADLQRVKGIGPKTAARIEPYLMFGPMPVNREPEER
jgi:DNA uptake protein ComE-like DNA-binding protein